MWVIDAIGGCALGEMDGADPIWPNMPIGEPREVARVLLAVLALNHDAVALRAVVEIILA